jgi:hypothetical protein
MILYSMHIFAHSTKLKYYIQFQSLLVHSDLPTDNFFSDLKTSGSTASLVSDYSEWEIYQTCLLSKHYYRCHLFTSLLAYVIKYHQTDLIVNKN